MTRREARDKMFKDEAASYKKRQEEKASGKSNYKKTYENVAYVALETNADKVVRLLGEPLSHRSLPTSMKKIIHSPFVLNDAGKYCQINWDEDRNWILWQVFFTVMKSRWEGDTKIYENKERCPDIFNRVYRNNNMKSKIISGMRPNDYIAINCIDRMDMDWHRENKKTKILSKKGKVFKTKSGEDAVNYEIGIPFTLYDMITKKVIEPKGDFEQYDIIIQKFSDLPYYEVYHPTMDKDRIAEETMKYVNPDSISEEELSWTMWDLDKIFPVTNYHKIRKNLGKLFKQVDLEFSTNFADELEELCSIEKKEWEKLNVENNKSTYASSDVNDSEEKEVEVEKEVDVEVKEEKKVRKSRGSVKKEEVKEETDLLTSLVSKGWNGIEKLSDEEKSLIIGYNEEEDELEYDFSEEELAACNVCDKLSPDPDFTFCPYCGKEF